MRRHAACGTRAQIKAKLEEYGAIGLDELVIAQSWAAYAAASGLIERCAREVDVASVLRPAQHECNRAAHTVHGLPLDSAHSGIDQCGLANRPSIGSLVDIVEASAGQGYRSLPRSVRRRRRDQPERQHGGAGSREADGDVAVAVDQFAAAYAKGLPVVLDDAAGEQASAHGKRLGKGLPAMAVNTGCTENGLMAIKATEMRRVALSATAAVVMGSRRNRWQAIHSVPAPPSSAARACAAAWVMGARPSMATPISVMKYPQLLE